MPPAEPSSSQKQEVGSAEAGGVSREGERRTLQRDRMLRDLGELCYKAHREGAGTTRAMLRKFREMASFDAGSPPPEAYLALALPEPRKQCRCGVQHEVSAKYCPACGIPLVERAAIPPSCSGCGEPVSKRGELCDLCKMKETASRKRLVRHPLTGQEMSIELPDPSPDLEPREGGVRPGVVPASRERGGSDERAGEGRGEDWKTELERYARPQEVDANVLAARGRELIQVGRYREAVSTFESVLRQNPRDSRSMYHLGVARYKSDEIEEAMEAFLKASRLDRGNPDIYNDLGLCHLAKGQMRDARDCYLEALRLAPAHSDAHYNLAQVYRKQGRLVEAVAHFRYYLQFSPRARDFQQVVELIEVLSRGASTAPPGPPRR